MALPVLLSSARARLGYKEHPQKKARVSLPNPWETVRAPHLLCYLLFAVCVPFHRKPGSDVWMDVLCFQALLQGSLEQWSKGGDARSPGCRQGGPPGHWSDLAFAWEKTGPCGAFLGPGSPRDESLVRPGDLANSVALEPAGGILSAAGTIYKRN
jgi:hypothetical protein